MKQPETEKFCTYQCGFFTTYTQVSLKHTYGNTDVNGTKTDTRVTFRSSHFKISLPPFYGESVTPGEDSTSTVFLLFL
jgi:hypothetical protein